MVHIVVPVKDFSTSKTRLASRMSQIQRQIFSRAMAENVLKELARMPQVKHVTVATSEKRILSLLSTLGFDHVLDPEIGGCLNRAITQGIDHAVQKGAQDIAVVLADLPLFNTRSFSRVLEVHAERTDKHVTIVGDDELDGTNIRLTSHADLLPALYGKDSFSRHKSAAQRNGAQFRSVACDALSLDLDVPSDLGKLLRFAQKSTVPLNEATSLLAAWQPLWSAGSKRSCA